MAVDLKSENVLLVTLESELNYYDKILTQTIVTPHYHTQNESWTSKTTLLAP